mgnify:CR=1 FL=1
MNIDLEETVESNEIYNESDKNEEDEKFSENEFNIKVGPEDMVIENFMSVGHIVSYVKGK